MVGCNIDHNDYYRNWKYLDAKELEYVLLIFK